MRQFHFNVYVPVGEAQPPEAKNAHVSPTTKEEAEAQLLAALAVSNIKTAKVVYVEMFDDKEEEKA